MIRTTHCSPTPSLYGPPPHGPLGRFEKSIRPSQRGGGGPWTCCVVQPTLMQGGVGPSPWTYLVAVSRPCTLCVWNGVCGSRPDGHTFRSDVFSMLLQTPWSEEHPAPHLDTMKAFLKPSTPKQPAATPQPHTASWTRRRSGIAAGSPGQRSGPNREGGSTQDLR